MSRWLLDISKCGDSIASPGHLCSVTLTLKGFASPQGERLLFQFVPIASYFVLGTFKNIQLGEWNKGQAWSNVQSSNRFLQRDNLLSAPAIPSHCCLLIFHPYANELCNATLKHCLLLQMLDCSDQYQGQLLE